MCHLNIYNFIEHIFVVDNIIFEGERFSLTFDEWTSNKNRRYLNINVHSYSKNIWNSGLVRVSGTLPAEKCNKMVEKKLEEYGLSLTNNIVCITTDGASVMTKVGRLIKPEQQLCFAHAIQLAVIKVLYTGEEITQSEYDFEFNNDEEEDEEENMSNEYNDLEYEMDLEWVINKPCFTHIIQNKDHFAPLVEKIRKVIKIFRRSPTKNDQILQKYVKDLGKECQLILDCKTRWNSLLNMLERFYQLRDCIQKALIDLKEKIAFTEDYTQLKMLISALLPITLTVEACCRQDASLLSANAALQFMFNELAMQNSDIASELKRELRYRIIQRQTPLNCLLGYLHNANEFAEDCTYTRIKKTEMIEIIVSLLTRLKAVETDPKNLIEINKSDNDKLFFAEIKTIQGEARHCSFQQDDNINQQ